MKELTFYRCGMCGNVICMVEDSGIVPACCGEEMEKLIPNTADTSAEKHVPVICCEENGIRVAVGSRPHPMTEEHYIEWLTLQTNRGTYSRRLLQGNNPKACFCLGEDEYPVRAYAWCNLHGLWLQCMEE